MANIPLTSKQMTMQAAELYEQHVNGLQPRWLVELDKATVVRASLGAEPSMEYHAGGRAYFVRAQDELEAFMKARKMEAENK
jgi:hypothetical protein